MDHNIVFDDGERPTAASKTAAFALNKEKQIENLGADTHLVDFEVVVNDDDKNVNIQCSTAFYEAVAKPVICGLSEGTILNINNISIHCTHIDHNRDSKCYEYNRSFMSNSGAVASSVLERLPSTYIIQRDLFKCKGGHICLIKAGLQCGSFQLL